LYSPEDRYRLSRLGFLRTPLVKNASTPHPKRAGLFASDMFGVLGERTSRIGLLAGFLSQKEHFGSLETWMGSGDPTLSLWASGDGARLDPGQGMTTDWACLQFLHLDTPDPLAPYLEAVARENDLHEGGKTEAASPAGWCSWYQFSTEDFIGLLNEDDIRSNLEAMRELEEELPLKIIQIDDGYQSEIGDWLSFNDSFPEGLTPLASSIHQAGFTPGLWLSPFIVHPKSKLTAQHPDWLLRNRFKRPVNAGFLWGRFMQGLDLTHPDAMAYIKDVIHTAVDKWGFPYLKLDFLYAAALPGRHRDASRTRAQVMRAGLEAVREAAGEDTFILGCSCPLGSAVGLVDAMRISPDTARRWNSSYRGIRYYIRDEPSFPSAFNAAHSSLVRSNLHRRWWINDPDCLLLRPDTHLTEVEVQTIASVIALTGGSLILSDHLPELPPERRQIAASLLPLIGKRPFILDWFDSVTPQRVQLDLEGPQGGWHLIGLFNWQDETQDFTLQQSDFYLKGAGEMYAREFWSGETYILPDELASPEGLILEKVPPHGVVLFALQPRRKYRPQYLGSDLHISQGLEVIDWQANDKSLRLTLARPGRVHGRIDLAIPNPIESTRLDGVLIPWETLGEGMYSFELKFKQRASLEINYR
jgi:alpha-galactosidase